MDYLSKFIFFTSLFFFGSNLFAQFSLPILKANSATLTIKDGNEFRGNYWTVSPEIELDVYQADKTSEVKTVSYFSDIDSISFEIKPHDKFDFIVLLNGKDTCRQRVESGITFRMSPEIKYIADTIPFTLTEANNISIQAVINKMDTVDLMFHTAAGGTVSLTENATEKINTLNFDKKYESVQSWGGQGGSSRVADGNTMRIVNFYWENVRISEGKLSGPGTDGKFGPFLFQDKVIEIVYDENMLVVHSLPPKLDEGYSKYNLVFKQGNMFLEGTGVVDGVEYKNQFLIHSGYSGSILFDDKYAEETEMGRKLKVVDESELKDSQGNVLKTKSAIMPNFKVGNTVFNDIPVSFFEGAIGRQKMSVIGGNLLKRFNIILDLQNAYLYLKPNSFFDIAFSD